MNIIKPKPADASIIAGMGGYGCMYFNEGGTYEPSIPDRHICAIQTLASTTIESVAAAWDAPADNIENVTFSEETFLYVKAASVKITSGEGILYYGNGTVEEAGDAT